MTSTITTHGDIGYVSVWTPDIERAAAFYAGVLGWRYSTRHDGRGRRVEGLGQRLGMRGGEESGTFLAFAVDDAAEAVRRVREAGGSAGEPAREPYGLSATCADDQGMPFSVYEDGSPRPAEAPPVGPGEIVYLTIEVPDSTRARAFLGSVFGWRFSPGTIEDGWQVDDVRPMAGLSGGHDRPTVVPMYSVADIDDAVARVRAAGGTSTDPERQPYGRTAECADDQGGRFYLGQV